MFLTLTWLAWIAGFTSSSYATSVIKKEDRVSVASDCQLRARFEGAVHVNEKIFWKFTKLDTNCPDLASHFQIIIPPAQWHSAQNRVIYPQFLDEPNLRENYRLKLTELENNWHLTNFTDGMSHE